MSLPFFFFKLPINYIWFYTLIIVVFPKEFQCILPHTLYLGNFRWSLHLTPTITVETSDWSCLGTPLSPCLGGLLPRLCFCSIGEQNTHREGDTGLLPWLTPGTWTLSFVGHSLEVLFAPREPGDGQLAQISSTRHSLLLGPFKDAELLKKNIYTGCPKIMYIHFSSR